MNAILITVGRTDDPKEVEAHKLEGGVFVCLLGAGDLFSGWITKEVGWYPDVDTALAAAHVTRRARPEDDLPIYVEYSTIEEAVEFKHPM